MLLRSERERGLDGKDEEDGEERRSTSFGFRAAARPVRGEDVWGAARTADDTEEVRAKVASENCMVAW